MKEEIPCIKCTDKLWEYIKMHLSRWDYNYSILSMNNDFNDYPLLIINWRGKLGDVSNLSMQASGLHDRELVTNVEEFLERAARLKGFTYKRKDMEEFNTSNLRAGMIVELEDGTRRLILTDNQGHLFASSLDKYSNILYTQDIPKEIVKVYEINWLQTVPNLLNDIRNLRLIWERPKKVELTMQEIADKFGIPVEQLRIKE